jgi:hypothetical protein
MLIVKYIDSGKEKLDNIRRVLDKLTALSLDKQQTGARNNVTRKAKWSKQVKSDKV